MNKLKLIHSNLKIKGGTFEEELPEQKIAVKYLTGKEKILEIGGNIGRNSLVISSILDDSNNLVVLESMDKYANTLVQNRDLNNFNFKVINKALSKRKLIQRKWTTKPSEILLPKHQWVNTITFEELKKETNINFDTLVIDCEGAFYYILLDMPEIIDNIHLIIVENDYTNIIHKQYVDEILIKNNFKRDYFELGGNENSICHENFYEVWIKKI